MKFGILVSFVDHLAFKYNLPKLMVDFNARVSSKLDVKFFGEFKTFICREVGQRPEGLACVRYDTSMTFWIGTVKMHLTRRLIQCQQMPMFVQPSKTKSLLDAPTASFIESKSVSCFIRRCILVLIFCLLSVLSLAGYMPLRIDIWRLLVVSSNTYWVCWWLDPSREHVT